MKLDLSEIAGSVGKKFHYDINEQRIESEELRCLEPVTGSIDFTNTGRLIIARGAFTTKIELDCSRCLEKLVALIKVTIDEQLPIVKLQTVLSGHDEEAEIEESEKEPLFVNNVFDLSEYIRQQILIETPIRPLCDEACKGLCPTCGTNLNEGPCNCPIDIKASPFSTLAELLEDEGKKDKD